MRTLIACYSYTGNTMVIAQRISETIDADLTRIQPLKDRWYMIKAIHAYLEKKWPIQDCITDLSEYDCLLLCCPVWAGRAPPGVNQYLSELKNVKGKKLVVMVTMGGNGNQGATDQIKTALEVQGMEFVKKLIINGNDQKSGEWVAKVDEFQDLFRE
ncbi:flavodoxin [Methanobacterium sp. CWC-01]|jgi:flavodoxin|uniref:flavodoxin family protein n=1 Tax=Methanobacterium aridiramus TaxID=2584467 RepID=UPI0025749678|nr:flavodoxin [Methanobacterium sp. CWC-01]WJI09475.1 flavodoxin [Methanobacterium sp. CWC-01]